MTTEGSKKLLRYRGMSKKGFKIRRYDGNFCTLIERTFFGKKIDFNFHRDLDVIFYLILPNLSGCFLYYSIVQSIQTITKLVYDIIPNRKLLYQSQYTQRNFYLSKNPIGTSFFSLQKNFNKKTSFPN